MTIQVVQNVTGTTDLAAWVFQSPDAGKDGSAFDALLSAAMPDAVPAPTPIGATATANAPAMLSGLSLPPEQSQGLEQAQGQDAVMTAASLVSTDLAESEPPFRPSPPPDSEPAQSITESGSPAAPPQSVPVVEQTPPLAASAGTEAILAVHDAPASLSGTVVAKDYAPAMPVPAPFKKSGMIADGATPAATTTLTVGTPITIADDGKTPIAPPSTPVGKPITVADTNATPIAAAPVATTKSDPILDMGAAPDAVAPAPVENLLPKDAGNAEPRARTELPKPAPADILKSGSETITAAGPTADEEVPEAPQTDINVAGSKHLAARVRAATAYADAAALAEQTAEAPNGGKTAADADAMDEAAIRASLRANFVEGMPAVSITQPMADSGKPEVSHSDPVNAVAADNAPLPAAGNDSDPATPMSTPNPLPAVAAAAPLTPPSMPVTAVVPESPPGTPARDIVAVSNDAPLAAASAMPLPRIEPAMAASVPGAAASAARQPASDVAPPAVIAFTKPQNAPARPNNAAALKASAGKDAPVPTSPATTGAPAQSDPAPKPVTPVVRADDAPTPPQHSAADPGPANVPPPQGAPAPHAAAMAASDPTPTATIQPQIAAAAIEAPVHLQLRMVAGLPSAAAGMEALALRIAAKSSTGASEFSIRLDPPGLGGIDVKLHVDAQGQAQASLTAEKPQTLDLLQRDSGVLERALKDAGLDLGGGLSFSLKSDGDQGQGREAPGQAPLRSMQIAAVESANANIIASAAAFANDAGAGPRLDIRV